MGNIIRAGLLASALLWPRAGGAETAEIDLALVLAIDCSYSVDQNEYRLQMQGLGQALQDPDVWDAIQRGPKQRIAVTAFQWSDSDNQQVVLPWTLINSADTALRTGRLLQTLPRQLAEGGTAISNAMLFGGALFRSAPAATRRVIDMSTDGRSNIGPPLRPVRSALLSAGITINALVILNEFPTLDVYAANLIVGGQGHFVVRSSNYDDYGAAMLRKLVKEITGPGVT